MCEQSAVNSLAQDHRALVVRIIHLTEPSDFDSKGVQLFQIDLEAGELAAQVQPGQFVHMALPQGSPHILRRPISVYKRDIFTGIVSLLIQIMGDGTRCLSSLETGTHIPVLGPLGRGWNSGNSHSCLLVGGGVGAAPLYLLAEQLAARGAHVDVVLGAATADLLVCEKSYTGLFSSEHVHLATDDGSKGIKGFTTHVVARLMQDCTYQYVATCGPEPMLKAVVLQQPGAIIEVSLERRMACGIGACLSCTFDSTQSRLRACLDGPVFDGREVCW
ncbi:MAG: dihydroorotate dehydrogenase electron transfer subunit [Coriobacteriia bacterium]|nr:dihydroorotate dehydrogenase electron transfer subunit [Coriobacteriia bacterium]